MSIQYSKNFLKIQSIIDNHSLPEATDIIMKSVFDKIDQTSIEHITLEFQDFFE